MIYFILHRDEKGYAELGIKATGELFIRYSNTLKVTAEIPLGMATDETIEKLQVNLDRVYDIFLSQEEPEE